MVITGGKAPPQSIIEPLLRECDFLVAADSGLEQSLLYGRRPDLVVGDMDSLSNRALLDTFAPEQVKIYPTDKDYTDTELALDEIAGYDKKILIGGGEGRLDHTLALLALFESDRRPDFWFSRREEIFLLDRCLELEGKPGELISFYPLGNRDVFFKSEGLVWPLEPVRWDRGELSLSNRFRQNKVSLERVRGSLLVIRSFPDLPA